MLYSFARCIKQIIKVITFLPNSTIDISFTINWIELTRVDNKFQLPDKLGTFQKVQILQLVSKTSP